jgi:hypothetical protein
MLLLSLGSLNTINVTWFQRRINATGTYVLQVQCIATNQITTITIQKSSNLSAYPARFDRFQINSTGIPVGQFRYTVYDYAQGASAPSGVVETGLGYVTGTPSGIYRYNANQTYSVYYGLGIFDQTFDLTFN